MGAWQRWHGNRRPQPGGRGPVGLLGSINSPHGAVNQPRDWKRTVAHTLSVSGALMGDADINTEKTVETVIV